MANMPQQNQHQRNSTAEMCDKIRNRGTLTDMVIISREDLDALIQEKVDEALKGVRDAISNIAGN
jgi:hypothetical protein